MHYIVARFLIYCRRGMVVTVSLVQSESGFDVLLRELTNTKSSYPLKWNHGKLDSIYFYTDRACVRDVGCSC